MPDASEKLDFFPGSGVTWQSMGGSFRVSWSLVALACLTAGCADDDRRNPNQLRDTLGVTLGWACSDKGCVITSEPPAFVACGEAQGFTLFLDQVALMCSSTIMNGSSSWYAEDCRPLACSTNDDCPFFEGRTYDCHKGLCETSDIAVEQSSDRLVALCMSTAPRPTDCYTTDPVAEALMASNCDDSGCTLPSTCLQP